jgi:SAM-dependent methyltransferase
LTDTNINNFSYTLQCRQKWLQLQKWYKTELGQVIFKNEEALIKHELESCFGYSIVQLGNDLSDNIIHSARIKNKHVIQCYFEPTFESAFESNKEDIALVTLLQRLALKSNSVDVVVLHHSLEFESFPHEILREVERILVAEGKLLIVLFNPYSLIGLWHYFLRIKSKLRPSKVIFPTQQAWISTRRLDDWLSLLGFDAHKSASTFFRPPINNKAILSKLDFMESTGKRFWSAFAGIIVYRAIKRVSTLTPLTPKWRLNKKLVGSRLPETSNRDKLNTD